MSLRHLDLVGPDDLVLLDRGYIATWYVHLLQTRQQPFCCRIPAGQYVATKAFRDSGKAQGIVVLPPSRHSRDLYGQLGLPFEPIRVRILRVPTSSEKDIFLLTSLPDPVEVFAELYPHRWPTEEFYKRVKCRIEIERFTGQSAHTIYQDFHATILLANLTSMLSYSARRQIEATQGHCVHPRRMNWTQVLGKMKDTVVLLFFLNSVHVLLRELLRSFLSTWETFRPRRRFPRPRRPQKGIFHMAYKPTY